MQGGEAGGIYGSVTLRRRAKPLNMMNSGNQNMHYTLLPEYKYFQISASLYKLIIIFVLECPSSAYLLLLHIHLSLNECSRRGWQGASQISDPAKKTMPRLKTIIVNIICLLLLIIVCSVAAAHPCPFCLLVPSLESHKQSIMFPHHNKRLLIEIILLMLCIILFLYFVLSNIRSRNIYASQQF